MDGTPVYDIKPYVPYVDAIPNAVGGFAGAPPGAVLTVVCPEPLLEPFPQDRRQSLLEVLAQDPRPAYHHDPERVYGMDFAGFRIRFQVRDTRLTVLTLEKIL